MAPGQPDDPAEGLIEEILTSEQTAQAPTDESELLTFVIADIRGYTTFTHEMGDEAAARLTAKFASIVRELVTQFGGTVFELRGDEALCVFTSPRQSLRLAIALQQRFVEEMTADPQLPLAVGIGVDAGEAVRSADGYRGGALNLAARLCSRAKAGEVLASQEVTHLARRISGVRYVPGEAVTLKGLSEPVRLVRVLPEDDDPVARVAALRAPPRPTASAGPGGAMSGLRSPKVLVGAGVLAAAVAASVVVLVAGGDSDNGPRLKAFAENSVGLVDPASGKLTAQVGVDMSPVAAVSGFGSVWTANSGGNSVSRIDPSTRKVLGTIQVPSAPSAIAVGLGAVWVAGGGSGTVSRIDPTSSAVETITVGSGPGGLTVADGAVWVANTSDGTVVRIDPSQNKVTKTITVGQAPIGVAAGQDVWVANSASNTVSEIHPASASVVQTIHVGNDPRDVAVIGDDVWVSNNLDGTVSRIAASGTSVADSVAVGAEPTKLAPVGGQLWVATQVGRALADVDLASRRRVRSIPVGAIPTALVGAYGQLWVTTSVDPTLHTGGTVQAAGRDPGSLDPAFIQSPFATWLANNSYDALVGYRHAGGPEGTALVPDLATAIPEPTNGGLTYTFRLRKGIRWSTGAPVTVRDVERGLLRTVAAGAAGLAAQIAGAENCTVKQCHVSGIQVDPEASTIGVTLTRPSSQFLRALPTAVAVPADTPFDDQMRKPLPATGPYRIESDDGKLIVLTRNPHFTQWSSAAQPAGFPDRIEWHVAANDDPQIAADQVAKGQADWADVRGAAPLGTLQARFGSRLAVSPTLTAHGVALNTRAPPFDDVRVRRALAYAIDRQAVVNHWFAPARTTCQLLPPNFPGYRPYCPYTLAADTPGTWRAPDYPAAQRLMAGAPTKGMRVVVLSTPTTAPGMQDVVDALKQLGYRAELSVYQKEDYFAFLSDSRHQFQAGFGGWVADAPDPANFIQPFTCGQFMPADPNNVNLSRFCDHALDQLASAAQRAETSSLGSANELWAQVDKRLVDTVPWIALVNPSWVDALSPRVHNYQRSSVLGVLLSQMWVR